MPKNLRNGRKTKICEADEPEDWCFVCKDGGELVLCDHRDCYKVYHPDCVYQDVSLLERSWFCGRHYCFSCQKSPNYYCLGCINAVCKTCYAASEFVIVRGEEGLCSECLELVLIIEQNVEEDSEGNKISLTDRGTYETLFKEYWDIIKEKEGLTSAVVFAAQAKYEKSKKSAKQRRFSESEEEEDVMISHNSDTDDTCKHKRGTKRKTSKTQEFKGWGSKSLISFLTSIGKDVSEPLTRRDVRSLIHKYIEEKHLLDPEFKSKFIPDEKLIPIFGKKRVSENRIYSRLKAHFPEEKNNDENKDRSTYNDVNGHTCLKSRLSSLLRESILKKGNIITKPSCFASINADNINLVYLKRSLVQELSKQPESFKNKVIGAFVKVQAYPNDHRQRNYHHLVRVLGVNSEFLLQVSFLPNVIRISQLSDEDFTEQECETLKQKVTDGLLPKLTVVELQEKTIILHEDRTKHRIAMHLDYLQRRIVYANDKGRHKEKAALIDEKVDLERPQKQEQLLQQVPSVSPELIEAKYDSDEDILEIR